MLAVYIYRKEINKKPACNQAGFVLWNYHIVKSVHASSILLSKSNC